MRFNAEFTPEPAIKRDAIGAYQRLTMLVACSLKINATARNGVRLATW
jgi:hypothetical protein